MKIKNFQKNKPKFKNKINRAKLQALLITDGSVIPKGNRVVFANTSKTMIEKFCNLMEKVYGYKIEESKIGFGNGTKQKIYLVQFRSKKICKDLLTDMSYNTKFKVKIPNSWFEFSESGIAMITRNLFDADGGCSLRVSWLRKKKCFEIKRTVFLSCDNKHIRKQYRHLLKKLKVNTGESSGNITITKRKDIERFCELINFSDNVLVGYDSKHWQGIEKKELLGKLIMSYSFPRGFIQRFKSKDEIYAKIKDLTPGEYREGKLKSILNRS